jgi:cellulose synthase/poly-beta-1,6-N-acetylglucosamine synthase-like glycosyltransferase
MQPVYSIIYYLFVFFELITAAYVLVPTFLLVCYGIVRLFNIKTPFEKRKYITDKNYDFGIIITAHQETKFVVPLVDSILKQSYGHFMVYIVADDCKDVSDLDFTDPRIQVFSPQPSLNAKIKSIHYAIDNLARKHDAVIIFDADNLIHPSFLEVINQHFRKGYKVVQTNFKPKNTDSSFARMDAVGDIFNFFVEREGRMRLGLSSAIWGSGVAVDLELYREVKYQNFLGGFDKKLQSHLVQRVDQIAFAPEAVLFDEKISSGQSLQNQRTRWISSYFKYFGESWQVFLTGLKTFNLNLIYFGFNIMRPPLFMVLAAAGIFTFISFFVNITHFYLWLAILFTFVLTFVLIVAIKGRNPAYLRTLLMLPLFVLRQMMALLKLKKARKSFMKTEHTKLIYIDDLLR